MGRLKVEAARDRLKSRFPDLSRSVEATPLDPTTVSHLFADVDVVIDATDDPEARFTINDHAVAQGVPAVLGGVIRFEGVIMGVQPEQGPCFRCLFEGPPEPGEVMTRAGAGVLGAMAGLVGHLQVQRALGLSVGDRMTPLATSRPSMGCEGPPETSRLRPAMGHSLRPENRIFISLYDPIHTGEFHVCSDQDSDLTSTLCRRQ